VETLSFKIPDSDQFAESFLAVFLGFASSWEMLAGGSIFATFAALRLCRKLLRPLVESLGRKGFPKRRKAAKVAKRTK
jgi:hypothetical protein